MASEETIAFADNYPLDDEYESTHLMSSDVDYDKNDRITAGVSRPNRVMNYMSQSDTSRLRRKERSRWERLLDRAWEMRRCNSSSGRRDDRRESPDYGGELECRLMVRPRGREGTICMDMEEVKACRDLGLALPRDWTVEISGVTNTSSGGTSPVSNWQISSPGDDPREIKAKLKVWAQAVALASSSRLSS